MIQTGKALFERRNDQIVYTLEEKIQLTVEKKASKELLKEVRKCPVDDFQHDVSNPRFREILTELLHQRFSQGELQSYFTVNLNSEDADLMIYKLMPNAYPTAINFTCKLAQLFELRYVPKSLHGGISHFICDFIEDENGLIYFLKLSDF